jgi:hypothetical protein
MGVNIIFFSTKSNVTFFFVSAHPTIHKQQQQSIPQSMCHQNGGGSPLCLSPDPLGDMGSKLNYLNFITCIVFYLLLISRGIKI